MGAVAVLPRSLRVVDAEKALLLLASNRNLAKDIIYSTRVEKKTVQDTEKNMPSGTVFTAYTAYRFRHGDVPADYSEVYVYADGKALQEILKRFPKNDEAGAPNLFVLKLDKKLRMVIGNEDRGMAPDPLVFADLWNIKEWYAREFLNSLKHRIIPEAN